MYHLLKEFQHHKKEITKKCSPVKIIQMVVCVHGCRLPVTVKLAYGTELSVVLKSG